MGLAGCHDPLHHALVGKELHGPDGLLHRLYADVCEVPDGGLHSGHCRVHYTFISHVGVKRGAHTRCEEPEDDEAVVGELRSHRRYMSADGTLPDDVLRQFHLHQ